MIDPAEPAPGAEAPLTDAPSSRESWVRELQIDEVRIDELLLRPWRLSDAPALLVACADPEIVRWAGLPQPFGADEAAAFLADAEALWAESSGAPFAITDAATGALLGAVTRFGPDGHRATLGCWVAASARGRGVGTRVIGAITAWTFATTEAVRLEAFILAGNEPSHRMMARLGYQREGMLRAWDLGPDGSPADCVVWSRLRTDNRGAGWDGGSAWESNPPRDAERRVTRVEDEDRHRPARTPRPGA